MEISEDTYKMIFWGLSIVSLIIFWLVVLRLIIQYRKINNKRNVPVAYRRI